MRTMGPTVAFVGASGAWPDNELMSRCAEP